MFNKFFIAVVLAAPLLTSAAMRPADPAITGEEIEIRQDKMQSGYIGETRSMTLTLVNAQGEESVRKVDFEGFEGSSRRDKTVLRFTYPADLKGTALLTHEQGGGDDDQWLYLPSIKRVKRIASSNQSGSFMGSEFAYEDLVVRQIDKYTSRYLGDEEIDGKDCYVIERTPKNKNSGYSKVIRWRMKSNLQELKTDYFDRKGELLKQRTMEGHRLLDGFWRVKKIAVKNVQTNKYSTLTFDAVKVKLNLLEHQFSVQEFNAVD
jgi:hypothetical protein